MSLKEERMQILKMLEESKLSVEEAANLLSALEAGNDKERVSERPSLAGKQARWLRVRVTSGANGQQKVNINLPIGLASAAMKIGTKFVPELREVDVNELVEAMQAGAQGKIVEVHDDEDGDHVEIFIE